MCELFKAYYNLKKKHWKIMFVVLLSELIAFSLNVRRPIHYVTICNVNLVSSENAHKLCIDDMSLMAV